MCGLVVVACSGGDDSAESERRSSDDDPDVAGEVETTTTTINPEIQTVRDARQAAQDSEDVAFNPPTNPENPILHTTHTGVALLNAVSGSTFDNNENGNGLATVYPQDSQHRLDVQSVTFPDPDVAWLETCIVDDSERRFINNMEVRSTLDPGGVRTIQRTEEMRKEDGIWKLALSLQNSYEIGVVGCALEDDYVQPYEEPDPAELTQTIIDTRAAAEQAWINYLVDLNYAAAADYYTGRQLLGYFANAPFGSDDHVIVERDFCPSNVATIERNGVQEPWYGDPAHNPWDLNPYYSYPGNRIAESPCYYDYQLGQATMSFAVRSNGTAFEPTSSSQVVVKSVQLQAIDEPRVVYLTTCRTYSIDPVGDDQVQYKQAVVTATETMHLENNTWKVSNRWNFHATEDLTTPC
jgi:hypothetical protein